VVVVAQALRLNLGCGEYPLDDFINVDATYFPGVNQVLSVPPLPWPDAIITEIYCGHFLEHLDEVRGRELLVECYRVLEPGGTISIVVPDFREVARRYVEREPSPFAWASHMHDLRDLDELCRFILFSTCQASHHFWMYDLDTLGRALERVGFSLTQEIDRFNDPRLSTPQWYQCGLEARKV
jgi:predicted SAM-dependent methyltransferase